MNNIISVYELLGLIKDSKAPKKIEYKGDTYIYAGDDYSINDNREDWLITKYDYFLTNFLTEEVEIIEEEKEIEKIRMNGDCFFSESINAWINKEKSSAYCEFLSNKINELVDEINKLKKEK